MAVTSQLALSGSALGAFIFASLENNEQLAVPLQQKTVSQFDETVIPGEPASLPRCRYGVRRDPESRKIAKNQIILDPGSHPATRDLAGMTTCHIVSRAGDKHCSSEKEPFLNRNQSTQPPLAPFIVLHIAIALPL
jgi:hypothetical protein